MKKQTKERKRASTDYIIAVVFILALTAIMYISCMLFAESLKETTYATIQTYSEEITENSNINYMQTSQLNIDEIIMQNSQNIQKEEIIKKEKDLEYTTKYTENPELPKGMIQVLQEGIDGKQEIYTKKVYNGEKLLKEEQIGSKVTKSSVNKLVVVGTGAYSSNYNVKVGDTLYVTSSIVAIRLEANEKSDKIITLNKNAQVKLLQKKDEWYQVKYQSYIGWTKAECFTYLNPNANKENGKTEGNKYTKSQLINRLAFNMRLNEPSGLSLEQFRKIFANEKRDTKKIFTNNAQYFYYAEKQYGINGVFLAAVAIHESGWGGSAIATDKNNLFGYGAYDRSPYESSYQFSDYSEGIDMLARVFVKYYLNPAGTKIYDGNKATGTYYNGPTLEGVNVKYATDKNWANGVYSHMKYLYNNL